MSATIYVLIITSLNLANGYKERALTSFELTQEFTSKARCEYAGKSQVQDMQRKFGGEFSWGCYPK
jgi:hypothetical protein